MRLAAGKLTKRRHKWEPGGHARSGPAQAGYGIFRRRTMAFDWCETGMDFADALHLAGGSDREAVATFDRDFARLARRAGVSIREPS